MKPIEAIEQIDKALNLEETDSKLVDTINGEKFSFPLSMDKLQELVNIACDELDKEDKEFVDKLRKKKKEFQDKGIKSAIVDVDDL